MKTENRSSQPKPTSFPIESEPDPRVERWAVTQYRKMLRQLARDLRDTLRPIIKKDASQGKLDTLSDMNRATEMLTNNVVGGTSFAKKFAEKNLDSGNDDFKKQANKALGVPIIEVEPASRPDYYHVGDNNGEIKTWESAKSPYAEDWQTSMSRSWEETQKDYINKVTASINANYSAGYHLKDLTRDIMAIGNTKLSDAKRIARTENSKLQTMSNLSRMEKAGTTRSVWKSAMDDRVRTGNVADGCNHRALNGTVFNPKFGIPIPFKGSENSYVTKKPSNALFGAGLATAGVKSCSVINCRCTIVTYYDASKLVQMESPEAKEANAKRNEELGLPRQFGYRPGDVTL